MVIPGKKHKMKLFILLHKLGLKKAVRVIHRLNELSILRSSKS